MVTTDLGESLRLLRRLVEEDEGLEAEEEKEGMKQETDGTNADAAVGGGVEVVNMFVG